MPSQYVNPTHQILLSPAGARTREFEVGANATAAKMLPGTIVDFDAAGRSVKEAAAESHAYWGILEASGDMGIDDHYEVGDQCTVIVGECECLVRLTTGEDIDVGDRLVAGTDGLAKETDVGLIGEQGAPIGYSLQDTGGATGAVVRILIHFKPSVEAQAVA